MANSSHASSQCIILKEDVNKHLRNLIIFLILLLLPNCYVFMKLIDALNLYIHKKASPKSLSHSFPEINRFSACQASKLNFSFSKFSQALFCLKVKVLSLIPHIKIQNSSVRLTIYRP